MRSRRAIVLCSGIALLGACERSPATIPTLTSELLALARATTPSPVAGNDNERAMAQIDQIATRVRGITRDGDLVDALNRVIFTELGFVREIDDEDLRYLLLPSVLALRRGSCVGLGQVYLAVAERLGTPLHGVLVPGHFFLRDDTPAPPRNVELLRRGEAMPNTWYQERYQPASVPSYMRPLGDEEVIAVVHYNIGNAQRRERKLDAALASYTTAATLFGSFAEAHASRGLVLQLRGDLDAAAVAYARARRENPQLPGIDRNLAALTAERRGAGLPAPPSAPNENQ